MAGVQSIFQPKGEEACDKIYIRCLGQQDGIKHYVVFGVDTRCADSDPRSLNYNLYRIQVDEYHEKTIMVTYDSAEVVASSAGGLFKTTEGMRPKICGNQWINYLIDNHDIECVDDLYPRLPIKWRWDPTSINEHVSLAAIQIKDSYSGTHLCEISTLSTSMAVTLTVYRRELIRCQEKKAVLIFAALKSFYSVYKYHRYPAPVGILSMMPRAMPCCPCLSILQNMSTIIIRNSCMQQQPNRYFVDILDGDTWEILLVVNGSVATKLELLFLDTYGITQFAVVQDTRSGLYIVQDYMTKTVGTITFETGCSSDSEDSDSYLQFNKMGVRRDKNAWMLQLCRSGEKHFAGDLTHYKESNILSLTMAKDLELSKKALVLSHVMITALLHCKILYKAMVPMVSDYIYRNH